MSSIQPPLVPPGQSPPFEVIDGDHAGGSLIIAGACSLVLSLIAALIRIYVRLYLSPSFGVDDWVLLGATVGVTRGREKRLGFIGRLTGHIVLSFPRPLRSFSPESCLETSLAGSGLPLISLIRAVSIISNRCVGNSFTESRMKGTTS